MHLQRAPTSDLPRTKTLIIVREPIANMWSSFFMHIFKHYSRGKPEGHGDPPPELTAPEAVQERIDRNVHTRFHGVAMKLQDRCRALNEQATALG